MQSFKGLNAFDDHYDKHLQNNNILSAVKAIRSDPFFMVVIDLSLPIEPKLSLVREIYQGQPNAKVITIEKQEYLKNTGALSSFSSAVSIDSIESFPDTLKDYPSKKEGERLFNGT